MNRFHRLCASALLAAGIGLFAPAGAGLTAAEATATPPTSVAPAVAADQPQVQIAILLDTSGSMDGLIDQAKSHLWKVVNEFATATRNGKAPVVKVALYEYGNDRISAEQGFIRQILPLTTDLDAVSEKLFALTTDGGSEYCGQVIQKAAEGLDWSASNKDFKAIFICGNEEFTQGSFDYKKSCAAAIAKGVIVNTIFCGNEQEGINTQWQDGALRADGKYMFINQNETAVHIDAPQDVEIVALNTALNKTYIAFGAQGAEMAARQEAQDANAAGAQSGAYAQRAAAKSSALYTNSSWDMVDALKDKTVKLEEIKTEDLPENMQKMSLAERQAHVAEKQKERAAIQAKIAKLSQERADYVTEQLKKQGNDKALTLDQAMVKAVREQSQAKQFQFSK